MAVNYTIQMADIRSTYSFQSLKYFTISYLHWKEEGKWMNKYKQRDYEVQKYVL
jgi:hypothetical protein